jgi:hypothetical protein
MAPVNASILKLYDSALPGTLLITFELGSTWIVSTMATADPGDRLEARSSVIA